MRRGRRLLSRGILLGWSSERDCVKMTMVFGGHRLDRMRLVIEYPANCSSSMICVGHDFGRPATVSKQTLLLRSRVCAYY
jgi:hypothetical protein